MDKQLKTLVAAATMAALSFGLAGNAQAGWVSGFEGYI